MKDYKMNICLPFTYINPLVFHFLQYFSYHPVPKCIKQAYTYTFTHTITYVMKYLKITCTVYPIIIYGYIMK